MSSIHIASQNQLLGSFSEEEVREGMRTGRFKGDELVWRSGMAEWLSLKKMSKEWKWDLTEKAPSNEVKKEDLLEPAWEQRDKVGFFRALLQTIGAVLFQPSKTFYGMKKEGGLSTSLFYYVSMSSVMFTVSTIFQLPSTISSLATVMPQFEKVTLSYPMLTALFFLTLLLSPFVFSATIFVTSFFTHISLRILRGANAPFEATFRALCYAVGSTSIFQLIPFFGGLLGSVWSFYASLIGLKEIHKISAWRAAIALLISSLILFVLLVLLVSVLYVALTAITGHSFIPKK